MEREEVALVMLEDAENRRDSNLRWLCGMPADSLLFLSAERKSLLVPWDINLAAQYAGSDFVRAYSDFDRLPARACKKAAEFFKIPPGSKIEFSPSTAYLRFLEYVKALAGFNVLCREDGLFAELERFRAVKDSVEIALCRKAAAITDALIEALLKQFRAGRLQTEVEAALFIEAECRKQGCEGTGFETLAAGPARSFAIHAFPSYTGENFGGKGLSILDFGVRYSGYTTDVSLTIARELSGKQEQLLALVEKAAAIAFSRAKPGAPTAAAAAAVDALFAEAGKVMPHALGHGLGLDPHEGPMIRNRIGNHWIFEPGMVIALEPGLYDPVLGGCRLENDILVTENGAEPLTNSRIVRL
jgi:Xaa-Pro dipeptidase